jgi:phosphate uptake regulator
MGCQAGKTGDTVDLTQRDHRYENLYSEMLEEIAHMLAEASTGSRRLQLSRRSNPRTIKNSITAFAAEVQLDTGGEEVYWI